MNLRILRVLNASFVLLAHLSEVFAVNMQVSNASFRCIERERQSLLALKQGFVVRHGLLSSWGNGENKKECCRWEGVHCSNRKGHVVKLDLRGDGGLIDYLGGTISPSLANLLHLNYLDLSSNHFSSSNELPKTITSLTHLKYLNLSNLHVGGKIPFELGDLFRLEYLDLGGNSFEGEIPTQFGNLSRLVYLDLGNNILTGTIPHQLGNLSDLQHLDLGYNSWLSLRSNLEWLSHLSSLNSLSLDDADLSYAKNWIQQVSNLSLLQELHFGSCNLTNREPWSSAFININSSSLAIVDLSYNNLTSLVFPWLLSYSDSLTYLQLNDNQLSGPIPKAFGNFTSLQELYLHDNQLEGGLPKPMLDICSLRVVDLSINNLNGRLKEFVPTSSRCASKSLQVLGLSHNQIAGLVPDLSQCSSLQILNLDSNKLNGTLTRSIGQLSNLTYLSLAHNSLQGEISKAHFLRLYKLQYLDLSFNTLVFNVSSDWVPPFQLDYILLASCKLGPKFPIWLQTQKKYSNLDISSAGISNTIPDWFWELSLHSETLNLSHNQIRGEIPNLPLEYFNAAEMDISSNMFEGSIPSFLSMMSSLDISNNKFSEAHSMLCANTTLQLRSLDLSNNQLIGELPECWTNFESLFFLDLTNNDFYGNIPSSMGALIHIQALHLSNNNLMGELPQSMSNCTELKIFEAEGNNLVGPIPTYIGETLQNLEVLILRSNHFNGSLPLNICHLSGLQILDLSLNNISGSIPKCFNNLSALVEQVDSSAAISYSYGADMYNPRGSRMSNVDSASLIWKGKESKYKNTLGFVRSIDLSSNKLVGEISKEIMNLTGLISLNLSRNMLSGEIPAAIEQLRLLDALDLSRNYLSGKIPSQLSQLGLLGVLDLSYNNLSGEIPMSPPKLQSFDASSYVGNSKLCGSPLSKCPEKQTGEHDAREKDDDKGDFLHDFYISMAIGFIVGFWGVCCSLFFKKSWGYAYFKFLRDMYDKLYVLAAINMAKLQMRIRASE